MMQPAVEVSPTIPGIPGIYRYDGFASLFTSKERDAESGLDYFGARYFSSAQGRFTSPDKPFADQDASNPQSWNLYTYGRNNPLSNIDPTGRTCVAITGSDGSVTGYKDVDGPGGTCSDAAKGDVAQQQNPSATATAQAPPSPELAAVAAGATRTGPLVNTLTEVTIAFIMGPGMSMLETPAVMSLGALGGRMTPNPSSGGNQPEGVQPGAQSEYTNTTRNGSVPNIKTNVSADEFGKNLEANGFTKSAAKDGTPTYTKDNTQYTVYPKSTSTGGPTAQVKVNGEVVGKIRLQ